MRRVEKNVKEGEVGLGKMDLGFGLWRGRAGDMRREGETNKKSLK